MEYSGAIRAKLQSPPAGSGEIVRERLLEKLDEGLELGLVVVIAPAGYGKTTLVGQWLRRRRHRASWLTLDPGDNDPVRFWPCLAEALGAAEAVDPLEGPESLARRLEGLGEERNGRHVLAVDDFQSVREPHLADDFARFLRYRPDWLRVVILSRSERPLPLHLWRARRQACEITAADLRFSRDEARRLCRESLGLPLTDEEAAALAERTEGWAAALTLASHSMRSASDLAEAVASFDGGHRHVADFLCREAFLSVPEEDRRFLLDTSVADPLCASLCQSLTGRADSAAVLDRLAREQLFIAPVDEQSGWYRRHPLFSDFLRIRLAAEDPAAAERLHERAAEWMMARGLETRAIKHLLQTGKTDRAQALIERQWRKLIGDPSADLGAWLDSLPAEAVQKSPELEFARAMGHLRRGRLERAALWACGEAASNNGAFSSGGPNPSQRERRELLRSFLHMRLAYARGAVDEMLDRAERLLPKLSEAAELGVWDDLCRHPSVLRSPLGYWGRLGRAVPAFRRMIDVFSRADIRCAPLLALAHIGLAEALYERNRVKEARTHLETASDIGREGGYGGAKAEEILTLAAALEWRLLLLDGRLEEAASRLGRLCERFAGVPRSVWARRLSALKARVTLRLDGAAAASDWLRRSLIQAEAEGEEPAARPELYDRLLAARIYLGLGSAEAAEAQGRRALKLAEAEGAFGYRIESWILLALARWQRGETEKALEPLAEALSQAAGEGCVRTFIDEGLGMYALLLEMEERLGRERAEPQLRAYVRELLSAFVADWFHGRAGSAPERLGGGPEKLTRTERLVLLDILRGRKNGEIADALGVRHSTVKTHINNMYRKLGVGGRQELAQRAGVWFGV